MDEKTKKMKFLQFQFCLLMLACTLLPDFWSLLGVPDFDIAAFCCQVVGVVGTGLALYAFHKGGVQMPASFLGIAVAGVLCGLLSLIPGMPSWLDYIGLVAAVAALFMSKKGLGIRWASPASQGAYLVLMAILLHLYDSIGDSTTTGIAALVGLVIFFIGLGKLKSGLDTKGAAGISRLKIAVILSIIAVIFGWIPLLGGIVAGILLIIGFIVEFLGYTAMMQSASLGAEGQAGAGKLRISMIILLVGGIINFFPLTGMVVGLLSLVALWFVFKGWSLILQGLEA